MTVIDTKHTVIAWLFLPRESAKNLRSLYSARLNKKNGELLLTRALNVIGF